MPVCNVTLTDKMTSFWTPRQQDELFELSVLQAVVSVSLALLIGLVTWLATSWPVAVTVAGVVLLLQYLFLGLCPSRYCVML